MTCTIVGSGFGLYGYLPAILECGEEVLLPQRYRSLLMSRDDVRHLDPRVHWCKDENYALRCSDTVIIAQRPTDQMQRLGTYLKSPNILRLLIEKPIAPDVGSAQDMLLKLRNSGKCFRIGYTFRYTDWGVALRNWGKSAATGGSVLIEWKFRANHYASNMITWKQLASEGGGALRFYGIHLIALLAELGYDDVTQSITTSDVEDEVSEWRAIVTGPRLPKCIIRVDTNCDEQCFAILADGEFSISLNHPFKKNAEGALDGRIAVLVHLCKDLLFGEVLYHPWYSQTIHLWQLAESRSFPCHYRKKG